MPTWQWILIAACAVIAVAAVIIMAGSVRSRRRTHRLKRHYGAEYDRLQSESGGRKGAERELTARERRRDKLDIFALTPSASTHFTHRWQQVQLAFIDDPEAAVGAADRLVTDVMRERGYPVDHFEQRAADISVEYPQIVEHYRAAHRIHLSQVNGDVDTEKQREAFVHYRALFESLLETKKDNATSQEATA
jgi:hypothetical protein